MLAYRSQVAHQLSKHLAFCGYPVVVGILTREYANGAVVVKARLLETLGTEIIICQREIGAGHLVFVAFAVAQGEVVILYGLCPIAIACLGFTQTEINLVKVVEVLVVFEHLLQQGPCLPEITTLACVDA